MEDAEDRRTFHIPAGVPASLRRPESTAVSRTPPDKSYRVDESRIQLSSSVCCSSCCQSAGVLEVEPTHTLATIASRGHPATAARPPPPVAHQVTCISPGFLPSSWSPSNQISSGVSLMEARAERGGGGEASSLQRLWEETRHPDAEEPFPLETSIFVRVGCEASADPNSALLKRGSVRSQKRRRRRNDCTQEAASLAAAVFPGPLLQLLSTVSACLLSANG